MMAAPTMPTMANVEPMAALFFKKEVPVPVPVLPLADWVSLGMLIVELKWWLDVVTWYGVPVTVKDEVDEVRDGSVVVVKDEESEGETVPEELEVDDEGSPEVC